jgi:LysM repeat protein
MADSNEIEVKATVGINVLVMNGQEELIIDKVEEKPLDMKKIHSMPGITVYMVKPKDTLWDIAKRFYTTVDEICSLNELSDENIHPCQPLLLVKKVES